MALQKYKKRFSNFIDLSFNCITEDRYIYVKNKNDECFKSETPFLKVLNCYGANVRSCKKSFSPHLVSRGPFCLKQFVDV